MTSSHIIYKNTFIFLIFLLGLFIKNKKKFLLVFMFPDVLFLICKTIYNLFVYTQQNNPDNVGCFIYQGSYPLPEQVLTQFDNLFFYDLKNEIRDYFLHKTKLIEDSQNKRPKIIKTKWKIMQILAENPDLYKCLRDSSQTPKMWQTIPAWLLYEKQDFDLCELGRIKNLYENQLKRDLIRILFTNHIVGIKLIWF